MSVLPSIPSISILFQHDTRNISSKYSTPIHNIKWKNIRFHRRGNACAYACIYTASRNVRTHCTCADVLNYHVDSRVLNYHVDSHVLNYHVDSREVRPTTVYGESCMHLAGLSSWWILQYSFHWSYKILARFVNMVYLCFCIPPV